MKTNRFDQGFTFIEFLISMTVTVIIMMGVYQFSISSQRAFASQSDLASMNQQSRTAMDSITRSIRCAGSDPKGTAFVSSVTDSIPVPLAQPNSIRVLADLPQDLYNEEGDAAPDGDTFDIIDNKNNKWDDNEDENGDGMLLPANADEGEDVTYLLSPSDKAFVPTGKGPWILIKRVSDGKGKMQDLPLAQNVIKADGKPGLEFKYFLRYNGNTSNTDTIPGSFADRWLGDASKGIAKNASSYTTVADKRWIQRVLVRFTVRSPAPDRTSGRYRYVTLESDLSIRSKS